METASTLGWVASNFYVYSTSCINMKGRDSHGMLHARVKKYRWLHMHSDPCVAASMPNGQLSTHVHMIRVSIVALWSL